MLRLSKSNEITKVDKVVYFEYVVVLFLLIVLVVSGYVTRCETDASSLVELYAVGNLALRGLKRVYPDGL